MSSYQKIWLTLLGRSSKQLSVGNSRRSRIADRKSKIDFEKLEDRRLLAAGNGLQAQYYDASDLTVAALVRVDSEVNFDWGSGSPDAALGADSFSVRWSGSVEADFTEDHTFIVNANDGARLWLNGQLLIDQFEGGALTDESVSIDLVAGRRYDIQLEYLEVAGNASVSLEWSSPSTPRAIIPAANLHASDRGTILAERWNGITGNAVSDLTNNANFPDNPSTVSTLTSFESNSNIGSNLGQRLQGYVHPAVSGPYTFFIAADQSAELFLSNTSDPDSKELIASVASPTLPRQWDASPTQQSAVVYLAAGQKYFIEALHKESSGADHIAVGWRAPGSTDVEVIDGEYLSPIAPTVRLFANQSNVSEGSVNPISFTVVRQGGSLQQALNVSYALTGEATNGVDYENLSGTITIPAGADSADLFITSIADNLVEGDESLIVELQAGSGYEVGLKSARTSYGTLQDNVDAPAGGTSLISGTQLSDFIAFGGSYSTVNDAVYGDVIQAVISGAGTQPFNSQLKQNIDSPVTEGDILLAEFRVRSVGGSGELTAIFESSASPFTKSLTQGLPASEDWTRVQIPLIALESYAAGEASFGFFLGYEAQTLQFADFEVQNYGAPKLLAPETSFFLNNIGGTYGFAQSVPVTGQPFTSAQEVETTVVPPQVWHIQSVENNDGVVAAGETMRFEFSVRATAGTNPKTQFAVQRTDTYETLYSQTIDLTSNWQSFSVDVPVTETFLSGGLQAVFNLGFELQTVEIGGFQWTNQDNLFDLDDLPSQFPAADYDGRSGTDAWRSDAESRIESERKSDVTINVTDANGQPLDGAIVNLRQRSHEFLFGSAISALGGKLDPDGNGEALTYQSEIERLFNTVVLENSLKWPLYENDSQRGIDGANFGTDNNLYQRGHNIIWPSRGSMPDSVWAQYDARLASNGAASAENYLRSTIEARFDEVLTTFDGIIGEWDVVNEPYTNHDVMDILGDDIIVDWYQRVRDFDADIDLVLNDFGIFASNGTDTAHRADFEYWLGLLNDANLLDVIGEQGHYSDANLTDITVLGDLINTYNTQFDKPIAITEFDVNSTNEQLQADYLRDYMMMSFSQSAVTEFLHWGFWEGSHWLPDAALYRTDFSIKPNGQAYEDLVFGQWWTDVTGTTRNGEVTTNAFRGEYDVTVQYDGQSYTGTVTVDDSGTSNLTINVPTEAIVFDPIIESDSASVSGDALTELSNTGRWLEPENAAASLSASLGNVVQNNDGTWSWTFTPQQKYVNQPVTITITDAQGATDQTSFTITAETNILDRSISYGGATAFGTDVQAPDKTPLLPGQTATFANYTSYSLGINRVVVDVAGLASNTLSTSDFEFRVGNSDATDSWTLLDGNSAIPLPTISVSSNAGVDQIALVWPDNAIEKTWLQVTIKATAATGLNTPDVFYFGNAIGETGNDQADARVNISDLSSARTNQTGFGATTIFDKYDFNRDSRVNVQDVAIARVNQSGFTPLRLIDLTRNGSTSKAIGNDSSTDGDAEQSPSEVRTLVEAQTAGDLTANGKLDLSATPSAIATGLISRLSLVGVAVESLRASDSELKAQRLLLESKQAPELSLAGTIMTVDGGGLSQEPNTADTTSNMDRQSQQATNATIDLAFAELTLKSING